MERQILDSNFGRLSVYPDRMLVSRDYLNGKGLSTGLVAALDERIMFGGGWERGLGVVE